MKIHTEIKKEESNQRTYEIEVKVPKTDKPVIPGEDSNKNVGDVLNYFENIIMDNQWSGDMGYEEKIEVLRQYSLYWFLKNILQVDIYPLPKKNGDPHQC
ncbi:MAG: hypothetical protein GX318_07445 [Clostridia bacterium]|nr:hypothetical protein [Clostridia bacterium]